jgi:hypothetical protein
MDGKGGEMSWNIYIGWVDKSHDWSEIDPYAPFLIRPLWAGRKRTRKRTLSDADLDLACRKAAKRYRQEVELADLSRGGCEIRSFKAPS